MCVCGRLYIFVMELNTGNSNLKLGVFSGSLDDSGLNMNVNWGRGHRSQSQGKS